MEQRSQGLACREVIGLQRQGVRGQPQPVVEHDQIAGRPGRGGRKQCALSGLRIQPLNAGAVELGREQVALCVGRQGVVAKRGKRAGQRGGAGGQVDAIEGAEPDGIGGPAGGDGDVRERLPGVADRTEAVGQRVVDKQGGSAARDEAVHDDLLNDVHGVLGGGMSAMGARRRPGVGRENVPEAPAAFCKQMPARPGV